MILPLVHGRLPCVVWAVYAKREPLACVYRVQTLDVGWLEGSVDTGDVVICKIPHKSLSLLPLLPLCTAVPLPPLG